MGKGSKKAVNNQNQNKNENKNKNKNKNKNNNNNNNSKDNVKPVKGTKWWKGSDLGELVDGLKFPSGFKDPATVKPCYYNFYNMYLAGEYPKTGWSVHQVLFPVITGLQRDGSSEGAYFSKDLFKRRGFYRLGPVDKCLSSLPMEHQQTTFKKAIKKVLDSWDTTKPVTPEVKAFQNMTAMLALTLLRAMVLNEAQLTRSFYVEHFETTLHRLTKWPWVNGYEQPHKLCITHCCRYLDKREKHVSQMFAMILSRWKSEYQTAPSVDLTCQTIIEKALLTRMKFNGLGLVKLTVDAEEAIGMKLAQMCDDTLNRKSAKTWRLVSRFFEKYINRNVAGATFYWARILDDEYLNRFSAKSDPYYAGIMAGIITSERPENSFEKATWYKANPILAEGGFKLGQAAVRYWKTGQPQTPKDGSDHSTDISILFDNQ